MMLAYIQFPSLVLMLFLVRGTSVDLIPRAWQFFGQDYTHWPEDTLRELSGRASMGLAFSGGGTRSYISSLGYLRGLLDIGVLDGVKYITGVSGGSWAVIPFAYTRKSLTDFLGNLSPPESISMQSLSGISSGAGRAAPVHNDLFLVVLELLAEGWDLREVWDRAVSRLFLEPAGIPWGAFFSWSEKQVTDILQRNPALRDANANWATVREGAPFLITASTLTGPECSEQISEKPNKTLTIFESTPLYVGEATTRDVKYKGTPPVTRQVGGFVEPFAFAADADATAHLQKGQRSGLLEKGVKSNTFSCGTAATPQSGSCSWPWTLGHAMGSSSFAPGVFLDKIPILKGFLPDVPYWSPATPLTPADKVGNEGRCGHFYIADGGDTVNFYVSGLIKRGVKTIAAFVNAETPLAPSWAWNPSRDAVQSNVDYAFSSFFGYPGPPAAGWDYSNNQIFPKESFATTVAALQKSQANGTGAVAMTDLETVANHVLGISAGQKVRMIWVYLSRAHKFEEAIADPNVKHAAVVNGKWDPRQTPQLGTFRNFPHWDVSTQLHQSAEQVNLLTDLSGWVIKQNSEIFHAALAHAREGSQQAVKPTVYI